MKYIPVEKLIAEIERRKESREDVRNADDGYYPESNFAIRDKEDDEILSIITSLQQEQQEGELEKEILDWIGDEGSCKNGKWTWYECNEMLRHFAEWGSIHLNARKK